jgi:hypothetical protein
MRLKQRIKTGILMPVFLGSVLFAAAQKTFKYQAVINKVDSTGFYKINLEPRILVKSKDDLSDIRIADPAGNFVPYISEGNLPQVEKQKFLVFTQVALKSKTDTGTTFIAENSRQQPVNTLWVKLNNTAVKRTINLSGSDDLKRWFAIEEDIPLQDAVLNSDGTYLQSLSFPASNYRYLKLLVNDKNKVPVKFLEAGIYIQKSSSPVYWPVPSAPMVKKDSNKITYITIRLNDSYLVNLLHLDVGGPKYYNREISVYQADKRDRQLICSAELNANKPADIFLSAKATKLELEISNEDNLPLSINAVKVYQANQFIVSYLEKGKVYKLLTGDANAEGPDYDLKFFADSIRHNIPDIGIMEVTKNTAYASAEKIVKHDYSWMIWAAIALALVLLSFLTLKMIKELNSKTDN